MSVWTERHHWESLARLAHWSLMFVMALMDMLEMQYSCCLEDVFLWHTEMLASALAEEQLIVKSYFFQSFSFQVCQKHQRILLFKITGKDAKEQQPKTKQI